MYSTNIHNSSHYTNNVAFPTHFRWVVVRNFVIGYTSGSFPDIRQMFTKDSNDNGDHTCPLPTIIFRCGQDAHRVQCQSRSCVVQGHGKGIHPVACGKRQCPHEIPIGTLGGLMLGVHINLDIVPAYTVGRFGASRFSFISDYLCQKFITVKSLISDAPNSKT